MIKKTNSLKKYKQKRDFSKTTEPKPKTTKTKTIKTKDKEKIFVIQKHDASHLHYDLRLEINNVLVSWAVPKGPSNDPSIKRLAVRTEDHPLEYAKFAGTIPEGLYGAGTVKIWDSGTYMNLKEPKTMAECLKNGQIEFKFNGKRLRGNYVLVRTNFNNKETWLLKKMLKLKK